MTWSIVEKDMPDDLKRKVKTAANRTFGTAGMFESDDIDNFDFSNRPNEGYVTRHGVVTCQMGLGNDREDSDLPGFVVGDYMSELAYRGFYRYYADCLASQNWEELNANTENWKERLLPK